MDEMQINPTTYIKSNIATVKNFMYFLSALLFAIVAGITAYVILSYKDTRENRFEMSNEFHFELKEGSVTVLEFLDQQATECEIPASVKYGSRTYPITTIAENAFTNNSVLTQVTIPDSVTSILGSAENGKGAFSGCTALKTVNIGNGVTHIGAYAFKNCVALNEITIPANVQFVSDYAFQNCLGLETIQLNGNGPLGENTFENCLYVKNLKLADDVKLNDNARKSLSKLTRLEKLEITDTHQFYQHDAENNCLLETTEIANDTLVLAGINAKVPASVTQIVDWSFGERTPELIYVPSSVKTVAENAFNKNAICTDNASKPSGWDNAGVVYTNAVECTFTAVSGEPEKAYVYDNAKGNRVYPLYDDLFPDVKNPTPFKKWADAGGLTYNAEYESDAKGGYVGYDVYGEIKISGEPEEIVNAAEILLGNKNNEAKIYGITNQFFRVIDIEYWHEFKSLLNKINELDLVNTYDFVVDDLAQELSSMVSVLNVIYKNSTKPNNNAECPDFSNYVYFVDYQQYLESNDWRIGLKKLINHIDEIEGEDLAASSMSVFREVKDLANISKNYFNSPDIDPMMNSNWKILRENCEILSFDVGADSPLGKEIATCEALNRSLYTKNTWNKLQACLKDAYEINEYSLNITTVRKALNAARENLHEVGFEDDMIRLKTWMSISQDLNGEDYETTSYETLISHLDDIKIDTLKTRNDIKTKFEPLYNAYNNLELIEYVPEPEPTIININTLPYFIVAVVLFTGAVVAGSYAFTLKRQMRRKK